MFNYKVVTSGMAHVNEKAIADKLQAALEEHAAQGWVLDSWRLLRGETSPYGFLAVLKRDAAARK